MPLKMVTSQLILLVTCYFVWWRQQQGLDEESHTHAHTHTHTQTHNADIG